jgi:hypothetical protein
VVPTARGRGTRASERRSARGSGGPTPRAVARPGTAEGPGVRPTAVRVVRLNCGERLPGGCAAAAAASGADRARTRTPEGRAARSVPRERAPATRDCPSGSCSR